MIDPTEVTATSNTSGPAVPDTGLPPQAPLPISIVPPLGLEGSERIIPLRVTEADVARLAHDLKNPLAIIQGYAQLLADPTDFSPEDLRMATAQILSAVSYMEGLVHQNLAPALTGQETIPVAPLNMRNLVEEVVSGLAIEIKKKPAVIETVTDMPDCVGCDIFVRAVMINLLTNAIRYGGVAGKPAQIEVGALVDGGKVKYFVRDHGPGIDQERKATLFQRRQPLDPRNPSSTGIGLLGVRTYIEKMGGQVGVEDTQDGGATFWFILPAVKESGTVL